MILGAVELEGQRIASVRMLGGLLVPVCLSASPIAFGSVRMEPAIMLLAESAVLAADTALRDGLRVQDVPYGRLRSRLDEAGQVCDVQSGYKNRCRRHRRNVYFASVALIEVVAAGQTEFDVSVRDRSVTRHLVSIPAAYEQRWLKKGVSAERLIELSFEYLLEREENTMILPRFSLDAIKRYFPGYEREIARRLRAAAK